MDNVTWKKGEKTDGETSFTEWKPKAFLQQNQEEEKEISCINHKETAQHKTSVMGWSSRCSIAICHQSNSCKAGKMTSFSWQIKRYMTKKSVRTPANRTGNNEGLRNKRVAKKPSCYCKCEIQLNLTRIVHPRQWQSWGRRKSLCLGGSLLLAGFSPETLWGVEGIRPAGACKGNAKFTKFITHHTSVSNHCFGKLLLQICS